MPTCWDPCLGYKKTTLLPTRCLHSSRFYHLCQAFAVKWNTDSVGTLKFEIRNPKFETISKFKCAKLETAQSSVALGKDLFVWRIWDLVIENLFRISIFEFRISIVTSCLVGFPGEAGASLAFPSEPRRTSSTLSPLTHREPICRLHHLSGHLR